MPRSCAVKGCRSESYKDCGVSFHKFPKDEKLRREWFQACNKPGWIISKTSMICSLHFDWSQFKSVDSNQYPGRKILKTNAVPTKHTRNVVYWNARNTYFMEQAGVVKGIREQCIKPSFQIKVLPSIVRTCESKSLCSQNSKNQRTISISEGFLEEEYLETGLGNEDVTEENNSDLDEIRTKEKYRDLEGVLTDNIVKGKPKAYSLKFEEKTKRNIYVEFNSEEDIINKEDIDVRDDLNHSHEDNSEKEIKNEENLDFEELLDEQIKTGDPTLCGQLDSMEDKVLLGDEPLQNSPGVLELSQTTKKAGLWLEIDPYIPQGQIKYVGDGAMLLEAPLNNVGTILNNKECTKENNRKDEMRERKLRDRLVAQRKTIRACNAKIRSLTKKVALYKKIMSKRK